MTVHLVGAGPGDPDLITVRGRDLLARADVILYDGLVDDRLLGYTRPDARRVFVGKSATGQPATQKQINELLVAYGRHGGCVVRLKGGDPFVFGRGGEEALALTAVNVPFEVVPGISSAIAAPAYAGIPVTHRGLAASVAIVTGHEAPEKGDTASGAVRWDRLATAVDTLVILMGVSELPEIARALVTHGRAPGTPVAVIERGSWDNQRVITASLATVAGVAAAAGIRAPATIVVGDVAALHDQLSWFQPPATVATLPATPAHDSFAPARHRTRQSPVLAGVGATAQ